MHVDGLLTARRQLRNIGAFLGRPGETKSIGLLFPGHGSQYLDVTYQYWDTDPEVRELIQDVDELCKETFDEALSNVIFSRSGADGSALSEPWAMQLAIFTASIVQSRKLAPLVPEPAVVLGHSLGEYAALVAAGALSMEAGLRAVASRAEVVSSLPREQWGGMVAVRVAGSDDEKILKAALNDQTNECVVEAIRNSPSQRIVAGTLSGLDELEARLQDSGLKTKRLPISHAYHSPLLHSCVAPLKEALLNLDFREPSGTVVISSVTGAQVTDFRTEPMAEMLATQLVRPFDFTTALRSFRQAGGAEAVEVGPNSLLTGLVDRNEESIMVVPFDSPRNDPKTNEAKIAMYIDSIGCESVGASVETSEHSQDDVLNVVAAASGYPLFALDISDSISTLGLTPSGAGNVQTALKTLLGGENDFSATAPFYEFAASAASAEPGVEPVGADELVGRLVESFAEATGYPVEVIEPDLDLEADLGIDSVKQAEVVASVSESVGVATGDSDFAGVSTVREFASRLASLQFGDVVGQLNSVTMIPAASAASAEPGVEPVDFGTEKDHAGRYILRAVPRELPQRESSVPFYSGLRILVVGSDDERITADMASQLEAGGAEVITLQFVESEPVGGLGQKKFVQKVSDFDEVRAEALHREIGKIQGVVWAHSFASVNVSDPLNSNLFRAKWNESFNLLFILCQEFWGELQEAGDNGFVTSLTRTANAFGAAPRAAEDVIGALAVGFLKSLVKELPGIKFRFIDMPWADRDQIGSRLTQELAHVEGSHDADIAYLDGQRYVLKVVPEEIERPAEDPTSTRAFDQVTIFSGGSRGITLECALALAEALPGTLVLLGTSSTDNEIAQPYLELSADDFEAAKPEILASLHQRYPDMRPTDLMSLYNRIGNHRALAETMRRIESSGLNDRVHYRTCDITNAEDVKRSVNEIAGEFGSIKRIVHGAGLGSLGTLPKKDRNYGLKLLQVKLDGFYHLVSSAMSHGLEEGIAFTSISGHFGMDGQTDYTAASALMSMICSQLSILQPSLRWTAMDWTAWSATGMATHPSVRQIQEGERGLEYISPGEGQRHFVREVLGGLPRTQVMFFGRLGRNSPHGVLELLDDEQHAREEEVVAGIVQRRPRFPLVDGELSQNLSKEKSYFRRLNPESDHFLTDHLVKGGATFPGVMHLEAAVEAAELAGVLREGEPFQVKRAQFLTFLKVRGGESVDLEIDVKPGSVSGATASLSAAFTSPHGRVLDRKRLRSTTELFPSEQSVSPAPQVSVENLGQARFVDLDTFYETVAQVITFGPSYRLLREARVDGLNAVGMIHVPPADNLIAGEKNLQLRASPIVVDAAGRLALMSICENSGLIVVPTDIRDALFWRRPKPGELLEARAEVSPVGDGFKLTLDIVDESGEVVIQIRELKLSPIGSVDGNASILQD